MLRALTVFVFVSMAGASLFLTGCDRDDSDRRALELSTEPVAFEDAFGEVIFEPFANSKLDAVSLATVETYDGSAASLRVDVQATTAGPYSGGALTAFVARDLRGYNVLSFWIKASHAITFDTVGFGEGNTGASLYQSSISNLAVTTNWQQVLIPIPDPSRLRAERGMFWFADAPGGSDPPEGYTVYIDRIEWATRGGITIQSAQIPAGDLEAVFGADITFGKGTVTFDVQGTTRAVSCEPDYFEFFDSADPDGESPVVAFEPGRARVVGGGTALVQGRIQDVVAGGTLRVTAVAPPAQNAPKPTYAAGDVASVFSDSYQDITVDTYRAEFGGGTLYRLTRDGNELIAYTGLGTNLQQQAIIEFVNDQVDGNTFDTLRLDVYLPGDGTEGFAPILGVRLGDFGPNGTFGTPENPGTPDADTSSALVGLGVTPETALEPDTWVTVEIPLIDFVENATIGGLTSRGNIAQLLLSVNTGYLFVDNIVFFRD